MFKFLGKVILALVVLAVIGSFLPSEEDRIAEMSAEEKATYLAEKATKEKNLKIEMAAERKAKKLRHRQTHPASYLVLQGTSWNKDGFDNIMILSTDIKNPLEYTVKDIEITCTHYANSGTKIDSNTRTIYEQIPANGSLNLDDFNMGFIHTQATKSGCNVTGASRA